MLAIRGNGEEEGAKKKTRGNVRRRKEIRLLRSAINFMMVVLRAEREKEEDRGKRRVDGKEDTQEDVM